MHSNNRTSIVITAEVSIITQVVNTEEINIFERHRRGKESLTVSEIRITVCSKGYEVVSHRLCCAAVLVNNCTVLHVKRHTVIYIEGRSIITGLVSGCSIFTGKRYCFSVQIQPKTVYRLAVCSIFRSIVRVSFSSCAIRSLTGLA